jgi:hypothetical protein
MNDRRGRPIRGGISILEHLEKLFGQRINYVEKAAEKAEQQMETLLHGFPLEYPKKHETEQLASMVKDIKEKDLRETNNKIDLKLSKTEYEQRHESLDKEMIKLGKELSNIQGRILGTGGVILFVLVVTQIFLHVFWKR